MFYALGKNRKTFRGVASPPPLALYVQGLKISSCKLSTGADFKVDAEGHCNNYLEAGLGNG